MVDYVRIDNVKYRATQIVNTSLPQDVPQFNTDADFPLTDVIILRPARFRMTIVLYERYEGGVLVDNAFDQLQVLQELRSRKSLFSLVLDTGSRKDCIIKELNISQRTAHSLTISLTIWQIRIAKAVELGTQFFIDFDGNIIGQDAVQDLTGSSTPSGSWVATETTEASDVPDGEKDFLQKVDDGDYFGWTGENTQAFLTVALSTIAPGSAFIFLTPLSPFNLLEGN